MKTLLIDSSYLMYRSYFAYPNLSFENQPVGAFFGFAKTILQLITEYQPNQIVFAGDTSQPTWRHKCYPDYKAGRAKIEDNLVFQIPLIHNWCNKITKNNFRIAGWEADDIIFTIGVQELSNFREFNSKLRSYNGDFATNSNTTLESVQKPDDDLPQFPHKFSDLLKDANANANAIWIFSADRDLYQMLNLDNLKFANSSKLGGMETFGIMEFETKYQLNPLQWLDYKAMVGDGSDNLKGIGGVGPKTATGFLQEVGSLYNFYKKLNNSECDPSPFLRTTGGQYQNQDKLDEFLQSPKNQSIITKMADHYEILKITYILSALSIVPKLEFEPTGFDLQNGIETLSKYGFKSLVTMVHKLEPKAEEEGLF